MVPTLAVSSSPPSPVPFVSPTTTSPTWDDYLANASNGSFEFPVDINFEPRETRQGVPILATCPPITGYASTSTSSGPSPSYSAPPPLGFRRLSPAPIMAISLTNKRKAFPIMSPSPPVVALPLSVEDLTTMKTASGRDVPPGTQIGRWTKMEHELFLEGLQRFGKSWKKISSLVRTRTLVQIRTHAQKYLQKQSREAVAKAAAGARPKVLQPHTPHQPNVAASLQQRPSALHWKVPSPAGFGSMISTSRPLMATAPHQSSSVNRLDQLLQDDNSAFVDEYYTSPTAIEDAHLRPLYTSEQRASRLAHHVGQSNKRRRLETSASVASSAAFEPLAAPDNLPSPGNTPTTAAAVLLLSAHETDENTNYTNAWL